MYRLHLNEENTWQISANESRSALVQEMARVMELEPANEAEDASRLVFIGPGEPTPHVSTESGNPTLLYEGPRLKLWRHGARQDVICEVPDEVTGDEVYHTLRMAVQAIHHHNVQRGGLTLHGALLEHEGRGILLAAKGGSGKSTCCRRLPGHWKAWCDDETLLALDGSGGYVAHPFPTWSHYLDEEGVRTWFPENQIPLSTIFFLEKAEDDEVAALPSYEAPMWLYHSIFPVYERNFGQQLKKTEKRSFNTRLFNNACDMARTIPTYVLRASLHGRFWEKIEGVLKKENP
jgi:SynChlorMet cassette protein ScmC